ncbi:MAG: hypothetical protein JST87_00555 [Bacteroidetes bacterium]|nr:hypothetical protein [Bacteroidota bacterium]MBS1933258.1 hypothetical protein [Bacteroidota bacterium]
MNKIKNNSQLREQKQLLRQRKKELEKAIRNDWKDLKESVEPKHIAEQLFSGGHPEKENHSGIAEGVSHAASLLTKKLFARAETKFKKWSRK